MRFDTVAIYKVLSKRCAVFLYLTITLSDNLSYKEFGIVGKIFKCAYIFHWSVFQNSSKNMKKKNKKEICYFWCDSKMFFINRKHTFLTHTLGTKLIWYYLNKPQLRKTKSQYQKFLIASKDKVVKIVKVSVCKNLFKGISWMIIAANFETMLPLSTYCYHDNSEIFIFTFSANQTVQIHFS